MSPGPPARSPRPGGGKRGQDRGRSGGSRRDGRPAKRAPTAAERRAAEVNARRADRPARDPDDDRRRIEERTVEQWIDEGALRGEATQAAQRAAADDRPRRRTRQLAPKSVAAVGAAARNPRRAAVLIDRLAQAQEALDRERFDEARRIAAAVARETPDVAGVHEVLGLAAYRVGRWKQAATELETAQALHPSVELLPVLADTYRALRRWDDVERVWSNVRDASPSQEILAEARIVAAGAQADRGDLAGALRTISRAAQPPKRVRDHHLRQWYVLADLHDRAGDTIEATRWFERIAAHDRDFVDVTDRLRALGRS
ncbi:MAG: hypothetical protein H0W46_03815 [Acidimicrobiia bacterium]|nr:hypothetical protein [Acidimicrobiia bacterium]